MRGYVLVAAAPNRSRPLIERARAAGWHIALERPTFWVAVRGPRPPEVRISPPFCLIGETFDDPGLLPSLVEAVGCEAETTLLNRLWGRYVAVRLDETEQPTAVLREPSGGLEVLAAETTAGWVIASQLPEWLTLALAPMLAIDWNGLAQGLNSAASFLRHVPLKGIRDVPPGAVLPLSKGARPIPLWRPEDRARLEPCRRSADAAELLRAAIENAVGAWAAGGSGAGCEISGGLDSAIVASVLHRSGASDMRWMNLYGPNAGADERSPARQVAEKLGVPLTLIRRRRGRITRAQLEHLPMSARPALFARDLCQDAALARRYSTLGLDRVIGGKGGDALFLHRFAAPVFTDEWIERGVRALGSSTLTGVARWTRRSVWSILGEAVRAAPYAPLQRGNSRELLGPAKRDQIAGLNAALVFYGACRRNEVADLVHPLLSRPIMDVCLALPSFVLTEGVRDRALARRAFSVDLPAIVRDRRWKGELNSAFGGMLAASLDVLRPVLLEGRLVEHGLLDRSKLETALTSEALAWRGGFAEIMTATVTEMWVRRWEAHLAP